MFQTRRCVIRKFIPTDLEDLYLYASNPKVGPMAGWKPHESLSESYQVLQRFMAGNEVYAIVDKNSGHVIGSIGIHNDIKRDDPNLKMLGYILAEPYWGQQIMVEVVNGMLYYLFTKTNIQLVTIYHFPFNKQSKRVIEKCGFKFEGIIRNGTKLYNGIIYDDYSYSISRKEFLSK